MNESVRIAALEQRVDQLECMIAAPTLPLRYEDGKIRNQRYPDFWPDLPVRKAVIALYRQVTIAEAVRRIVAEFGKDRAPSKSALQRCWKQIDLARAGDESRS